MREATGPVIAPRDTKRPERTEKPAPDSAVLAEIGMSPEEIRALETSGALATVPLEGA